MKKSKIVIFEANQKDGIFSKSKKFYPENYTEKDIFESIKKDRIKLGKKHNFSGLKMFQVEQKMEDNDDYEDNKAVLIDSSYMTKDDYFEETIKADILLITKEYPKIVLCHRMADCPVLILEDRNLGITAIVHCGIYHINRGLPRALIETMINNYQSKPKDLYLYIGSHIKKEHYIYDTYPQKLNHKKIWENAIIETEDHHYMIDMEQAIKNQIKDYDLAEIIISPFDTATTEGYASHYMANKGYKEKLGQNLVGFYYKEQK